MRLAQLVDIENRRARRDRLQDDRFQTDREERIMYDAMRALRDKMIEDGTIEPGEYSMPDEVDVVRLCVVEGGRE